MSSELRGIFSTTSAASLTDERLASLPDDLKGEAEGMRDIHRRFWNGEHCPHRDCQVCGVLPDPNEALVRLLTTEWRRR